MRTLRWSRACDRLVVGSLGGDAEHLELARGEQRRDVDVRGAGSAVGGDEVGDLAEEHRPGWLVLQHDVVVALERHQSGAADVGGEVAGVVEGVHPVTAAVEDQHRQVEVGQQVTGVGAVVLTTRQDRGGGGDRLPLQLVEPAHLLLRGVRDHHRGEHPPELRGRPLPADRDQCLERVVEGDLLGGRSGHRSGVAAVEHQPAQPLGVARGVLDRDRPALRHRQQREPVEPGMVSDRFQVLDPSLQRVVGDVAVGQAVAALVEPDHGRHLAQLDQVVAPHRALPVELQVAEPAGVEQQRWPGAVDGVRDRGAIGRVAETQVLHGLDHGSPA